MRNDGDLPRLRPPGRKVGPFGGSKLVFYECQEHFPGALAGHRVLTSTTYSLK